MSRSYRHNLIVKSPGLITKRLANRRVRAYLAKGGELRGNDYKRVSDSWDLFEKYSFGFRTFENYKVYCRSVWVSELFEWECALEELKLFEFGRVSTAELLLNELGFYKPTGVVLEDWLIGHSFIFDSVKFESKLELVILERKAFLERRISFCNDKLNSIDSECLKQYLFFKCK